MEAVVATSLEAAAAEREQAVLWGLKCGQLPSAQQLAKRTTAAAADAQAMEAMEASSIAAPATPVQPSPTVEYLLLTDFDNTLVDFDAGERVMEQLAPELLPMLVGLDPKSSAVPITNTLLAELQRRGVSRDQLLQTLQSLGAEVPPAIVELLSAAKAHTSANVRVLSGANSVFISHILAGAKVSGCVDEVTTNPASFERVEGGGGDNSLSIASTPLALSAEPQSSLVEPDSSVDALGSVSSSRRAAGSSGGQRLVVRPHCSSSAPHRCPRCPESLCKGQEVQAMRRLGKYRSIILCGDGVDDICAALSLGPDDHVMARRGFPLADHLKQISIEAKITLWEAHEELSAMVQSTMAVRI